MRYLKIYEEFEHTKQESRQMEDKYNEILNEKAVNIIVQWTHQNDIELTPEVRVWSGHNNLNEKLSYELNFRHLENGRDYSPSVVSITIFDGGARVRAWKESFIGMEDSEIAKILRMINDASPYIGEVDMNNADQELRVKLRKTK